MSIEIEKENLTNILILWVLLLISVPANWFMLVLWLGKQNTGTGTFYWDIVWCWKQVLCASSQRAPELRAHIPIISLYIIQSITSPQLWKFSQLGKNGHVLRQHYDLNFVVLEGWVDGDFSWDSAKWLTAQMVKQWFLFRKTAVRVKR